MSLEECLPAELHGSDTTITPIGFGLSGARVYRVESSGQAFGLKIGGDGESLERWRSKVHIQQMAANAGLTPQIIHIDEERRAVLSAFVVDKSFPAFFHNPGTQASAIAQLGEIVRRLHQLPVPTDVETKKPRDFLSSVWYELSANMALPQFVAPAVNGVLSEEPPACERPLVLSHNDVNPSNLIYDGEKLLLVDWDTAWLNDPYYDLACSAVFLRMDDGTCQKLLKAYGNESVAALPARFLYNRRMVAVLCGSVFLQIAHNTGYGGANGETFESTPCLAEFYQSMRSGALSVTTGEGKWWFGLALIKASVQL